MKFNTIKFEIIENFAILKLNRPDKLNALNHELFTELDNVITKIEIDKSIKAIVITGEGKAFAAGADIVELNKCNKETGRHFSEFGSKVMLRIENMHIPVIAAVNGFALGGGCELSMCCHIRFASEDAKFGQPEVNLGIIPGYGGTQRLSKLVGIAKSMELNLTGELIDANEALRLGLVNSVFTSEELLSQTLNFTRKITSKNNAATSAIVKAVIASTRLSPMEGLSYESSLFGEICDTADFKEGTQAFIEKRKPNFIGK